MLSRAGEENEDFRHKHAKRCENFRLAFSFVRVIRVFRGP